MWAVPAAAGGGVRAVSCARYLYPQPGGNPGANVKSISHICHPILVAFVWVMTKETTNLPLGCPRVEGNLLEFRVLRIHFPSTLVLVVGARGAGGRGVRVTAPWSHP